MEELFNKPVPVAIKSSDRDERQVAINITMLLNVVTSPVHKKELLIRLTDESDPFFLFTLAMAEEDFQGLKSQQGLLVDFSAFPQKFIDLLELCLAEAGKESPKFLLHLAQSPADRGVSVLSVVEANPFRHLTHLSLKLAPASDSYLKKHLAECLMALKEENSRLSERLTATRSDLSAQLAHCEEALSSRTRELERLKSEWSTHTTTLANEHSAQLTAERERGVASQEESQRRYEQERRSLEQAHSARVDSLEGRLHELDVANKELTDHKYRSEAAIRELKTKLKSSEEECCRLREETGRLRRDNSSLDAGSHEQEKNIGQLRTRVAVLEQELADKEQVITRTSELLEASGQQKRSCEVALEQRQRQTVKLDAAFKSASQEVMKGNEIIQKLQAELRSVKSKLKLKNMVTTQQEKLLGEKEMAMERQKHEMQSLNEALTQKQEETKKLEVSLEEVQQKLEESRELLKTNENVISWLNKQMNEQMLGGGAAIGGRGLTARPPPDTLSTIRPSPPLSRPQPHSHFPPSGIPLHQKPQFSSTPAVPSTAGQRQILGSLASQENIRQQVVYRGPMKSSLPIPSPLSAHSHSAHSLKGATPTSADCSSVPLPSQNRAPRPSLVHTRTTPAERGEPWIDPKYLSPDATSQPFSTGTPNTAHPSTQAKGTKERGSSASNSSQGQAPLLSAYFPKS